MYNTYVSPRSRVRDLRLDASLCKSQLHDFGENDFYIEEDDNQ
jgi:hypothetical protein